MTDRPFSKHYEIHALIDDVAALLADRGITPHREPNREQQRTQGASALLSGLGVVPTLAPERALDLDGSLHYDARMHGD
jgi:hypothetical protein